MPESGSKTVLLIFSKNPVPGKVKTRLIPDIGSENACRLYIDLFHHTMKTALNSAIDNVHVWTVSAPEEACFSQYKKRENIKFYIQQGKDLGERMHFAIKQTLNTFESAILIGCDCPDINDALLEEACSGLKNYDIVIGPTTDGGYYLIGSNKDDVKIFSDIHWGSNTVLASTLKNITTTGLNYSLLAKLGDVDSLSDLPLLSHHGLGSYL